ncbi:Methyltransferase-like protein 9 [Aphanomyces cochlioides]|nr:Methyltransferase-like protein 9 [Aphanomyces cochlioides]
MRVAVVGCSHGELDAMYATIEHINSMENEETVQLLLCCGDFQCFRNEADVECMACPPKYRSLGVFHEYYTGAKVAPVLTIFIGGNHEASNYLQDLYYGGYVAPNIFYLGCAGVVQVNGLRIAGMSGIYKSHDYTLGHFERYPYDNSTMRSIYHVREYQVYQLGHLKDKAPIDIFLSHDWPRGIEQYGRADLLLRRKSFLRDEIARGEFGSPPGEYLLHTLQPSYWFSGHMHVKFAAIVNHPSLKSTKFLALDKCLPNRDFMQVVDIPAPQESTTTPTLTMDLEWLAVLRATHHLASADRNRPRVPEEDMTIEQADVEWIQSRLPDGRIDWICPFEQVATTTVGSRQTDALLNLLKLPHVVTTPHVERLAAVADPNSIDIDQEETDPNAIDIDDL